MRSLKACLGIVALALGLIVLPAAVAANPQVNHFSNSGTFTDTDFCGTGMTVEGSFALHGTEFFAPNMPNTSYWNTVEGNVVYTNPVNRNTVISHFAGPFLAKVISGDPDSGTFVEEVTYIGLPEQFRAGHGGSLTRDAGIIGFRNTWVNDELVSSEVILVKGPHPEAASEFALFCDVMTDALGLS